MTESAGDGFAKFMIDQGVVAFVPDTPVEWTTARHELVGTCDSAIKYEDLFDDTAFCAWIDGEIFCCTACGWWCEMSEEASDDFGLDEWTCSDCCSEMEPVEKD